MKQKDVIIKLKNLPDNIKTYINQESNNLEIIDSITTKKFILLDNIPLTNATYIQNQDDINKKNLTYYFNLNKILDNFKFGATVLIKINYKNKIDSIPITNIDKSDNSINVFTTSTVLNKAIIFRLYPYKEYNESFETIDSDYSCLSLKFQMGLSEEEIDMINNASITIYVLENKALNKDNEIEYTPSSDYNPATKKYVDDSIMNKADDLEVAKALNKSSTMFTKDFEVVTAKISDIITYTRIIDHPDDSTYKMVAFYCNLDKILDNTNKLDCYFVQIKYKYNGEYKIATCSSGIIYTSYMKLNMDNTITMSGTSNIANIEFSMKPNKIYQEDYSTIDSTTQCSIFIACGMCYINENNIDIIKDAEISVFLRRKNFLSLNNTGEYTPTSDYNPSTKKYVDDSIKALEDTEEETLNKLLEYGLVSDALMLENGTYLADENNKLLQF